MQQISCLTISGTALLGGVGSQYQLDKENMLYGGISQAYRPVIFKDIVPASTYEQIDKELKDALGYNIELGVRGNYSIDFSTTSVISTYCIKTGWARLFCRIIWSALYL